MPMFWTIEKLEKQIERLEPLRYRDRRVIHSFQMKEDPDGNVGQRPPTVNSDWLTISLGDTWSGRDRYVWLAAAIDVPVEWEGKQIVGRFDFGRTGSCHNSGFESLFYLDKSPYQGVDSNHQEVFFLNDIYGRNLNLLFRLWSGLEGGGEPVQQVHRLDMAELTWLDENADDLYFTSKAVIQTIKELGENQPERPSLISALNFAFNKVDWSCADSERFYETLLEANNLLKQKLIEIEKYHPVTIRCIGHTHIDVAWLWRLKHTREKAARSFSTVLRLMEKYPEYIFLQSQPQLYEYIKNDYPEIYNQIKARIVEKRWEIDGGMWLEADCNLPSGESLVRQLLYGTRFIQEEFGLKCRYLWLPDVFGYSWALPQILKKSGIKTFLTTKISWNQYNRMPHDTFFWRGIDGSEILTHFITTPYLHFDSEWRYDYNGHILPKTIKGSWDAYRNKDINKELLLSYGYGDGGGGVNREMLEMRRRLDTMPGLPHVKTGRVDEYFEQLHEKVNNTEEYVHTWDGELYLEYHRGTYTSQANNKRMNRKLELLYREEEFLCLLKSLFTEDWSSYPVEKLTQGWKIILRNQFHDIIPGSSISEVYEDSKLEYEEAVNIIESIRKEDDGNDTSFTVYNSAPWERVDLLKVPVTENLNSGTWHDLENNILYAQKNGSHWLVEVCIPPMGCTKITFTHTSVEPEKENSPFTFAGNSVETPFYVLRWNDQGQLIQIYDKDNKREVLAPEQRGNVFQVFEDIPLNWEAWDIDIYYQQKMKEVTQLQEIEVIEHGVLSVTIQFTWKYSNSTLTQQLILYKEKRRIDFKTEANWNESQQLLKVAFPVQVRNTEATYDIQFGNVKRPTHWNTSWDWARFESVGHQWVDLSENGYGVSLLNDCKYGHDIKDNVMRLTLIKTSNYPAPSADIGKHSFTYSLFPHKGNWFEGETVKAAWELNNSLTYQNHNISKVNNDFSIFRFSTETILVDSIKKAEGQNRVLLRFHDYSGGRGEVKISSDIPIVSWQECNLLEEVEGELNNSSNISLHVDPYEIKTLLIDFELITEEWF